MSVLGVGDHEGVPYYDMQFIQGLGLDVVIEELNQMQTGAAATQSLLPTGGEIRIARRDVSAADVARSLMTGTIQKSSERNDAAVKEPSPRYDEILDVQPTMEPVRSSPSSDSFSISSSSILLPGSTSTGRSAAGRKPTYWLSVANIGRQVAEALE